MRPATRKGPLPIVVGVTGHTDLRPEDIDALSERVRQVLQHLPAKYPHSELELLSPLAEGADRLVARVALDLGIRLVVPLPMEPDEYKKDFADAASIREFDELRARAVRAFVVPGPDGRADARPACYARLGAYTVAHSHVLLALWNGLMTNKTGGTASVVRFRLEGVPASYAGFVRLLDPIDTGVVQQIVTPRRSNPSTVGEPFALQWLAPNLEGAAGAPEDVLHRICKSTDAFNAMASESSHRVADRSRQSERQLLGDGAAPDINPALQPIVTLFGLADELAIRFQRRTLWTLISLFCLVFGAVVAFEVYAHVEVTTAMFTYLVLSLLAYGLYALADRRGLDAKHLDYRALAEGLRVQFYWHLAGIRSSAAEHYMRYRLEETEWIRNALRGCDLFEARADPRLDDSAETVAALRAVVKHWVEAQYAFFVKAGLHDHTHLAALERGAEASWWVSILGVLAMVGVFLLEHFHVVKPKEIVHIVVVAGIGLSTALAAFVHGYVEKRAFGPHLKRYARMAVLFQRALLSLNAPLAEGDSVAVRAVLRELGREALEENADWVMLHRERPLEVPQ